MRQRHSYSNLIYHLVSVTKNRYPLIQSPQDETLIGNLMAHKALELDSFILEFGAWYDHVHILIQSKPSIPLSTLYGQMKGYTAAIWNKRFPTQRLKWADGVYIESVTPFKNDKLRGYIRNQRIHHSTSTGIPRWELDTKPAAFTLGPLSPRG